MSLTGDDRKRAEELSKDERVHPVDAPKGSLRARLLKQMTAIESSSKTAVSNLLFNLCADEGTPGSLVSGKGTTVGKIANLRRQQRKRRRKHSALHGQLFVVVYFSRFAPTRLHPWSTPFSSLFRARPRWSRPHANPHTQRSSHFSCEPFPPCHAACAEEFTTRCGFGNAVNTLRLRGKISVPGVG